MHVVGCSSCEAKVTPSDWTEHQKTLHCSALDKATICSTCLFQSKVFGDFLSHGLLQGHELSTISPLNLSRLPIPVGPQRIPVAQKSIPPANNTLSESHSSDTLKSFEQVRNKAPNLPLQSLHKLEQDETGIVTSLITEPLTTYSQEIAMEESDSEIQILIRDDASDFGTSHPGSPDEPPESEEVMMLQEDNVVESYLVESLAMMAEERPDSTDIPLPEITSSQEVLSKALPINAEEITGPTSSLSAMSETTAATDEGLVQLASPNDDTVRLIRSDANPDLAASRDEDAERDIESETEQLTEQPPQVGQEVTRNNYETLHDRKPIGKNNRAWQSARCAKCQVIVTFQKTSTIIRHILGCKNIRPYSCNVCQGSWPTILLAKRHLSNCKGAKIVLRDLKQSEQAAWIALHECFSSIPVAWTGLSKMNRSAAKAKVTKYSQESADINSKFNQYATEAQEKVLKPVTKRTSQSQFNLFTTEDAVMTNTESGTFEVPEAASCRSEEYSMINQEEAAQGKMPKTVSKNTNRKIQGQGCFRTVKDDLYYWKRHVILCFNLYPYQCNGCKQPFRSTEHFSQSHVGCKPGSELLLLDEKEHETAVQKGLRQCFPGQEHHWTRQTNQRG